MLERAQDYFSALVWAVPDSMALLGIVLLAAIVAAIRLFTSKSIGLTDGSKSPDVSSPDVTLAAPNASRKDSNTDSDSDRALDRLNIALAIVIVGLVAATSLAIPNPRYIVLAVPIAVAATWPHLARFRTPVPLRIGLLVLWLGLNLVNQRGELYPDRFANLDLKTMSIRDFLSIYMARERSREIIDEVRSTERAIAYIASQHPDALVVTTPPYGHMLAIPFLGYVDAPHAGFCDGLQTDFTFPMCGLDAFSSLARLNASLLSHRTVLFLADVEEDSPELLQRLDPDTSPGSTDEMLFDSGTSMIWKLDPDRLQRLLRDAQEHP